MKTDIEKELEEIEMNQDIIYFLRQRPDRCLQDIAYGLGYRFGAGYTEIEKSLRIRVVLLVEAGVLIKDTHHRPNRYSVAEGF